MLTCLQSETKILRYKLGRLFHARSLYPEVQRNKPRKYQHERKS
jgi:hypothetical protein